MRPCFAKASQDKPRRCEDVSILAQKSQEKKHAPLEVFVLVSNGGDRIQVMGMNSFGGRFGKFVGTALASLVGTADVPADAREVFGNKNERGGKPMARMQRQKEDANMGVENYRKYLDIFKKKMENIRNVKLSDPGRWNFLTDVMPNGEEKVAVESAIELLKPLVFNVRSIPKDLETGEILLHEQLYGRHGLQISQANYDFAKLFAFSEDVQDAALADLVRREQN